MFIIKVRDKATEQTRRAVCDGGYALIMRDANKWKSTILQYGNFDNAMAWVNKQIPTADGNNRACIKRDIRIYEQIGRKQTLVYERLARD